MLGMFVANFAGGALPWRVAMWVFGDKETGKSTLIATIEALSGGFQPTTEDATAARVWQLIQYDSLALAPDEAGADIEPKRAIALLRPIRVSTGGGKIARGGADHHKHQFAVAASVMCSSITRPPMLPQDASRIGPIQLLKPEVPLPQPAPRTLKVQGAQIFQRVVDGWGRYRAPMTRILPRLPVRAAPIARRAIM